MNYLNATTGFNGDNQDQGVRLRCPPACFNEFTTRS